MATRGGRRRRRLRLGHGPHDGHLRPRQPVRQLRPLVVRRAGVASDPAAVGTGCEADALARVTAGELDAALAFRGGLEMPRGVEVIDIPDEENLVIHFGSAPLDGVPRARGLLAEFLGAERAKEILTQQGYLP
jgi:hypothetical protein